MRSSFVGSIFEYFNWIIAGTLTLLRAVLTTLPYLFGWGTGRKVVTEQYPDPVSSRSKEELPARFRGLLFNDILKCTGCLECEKICPAKCITLETEKGVEDLKTWVSVFDIDHSKCLFCGLCVEVCAPQSLVHTRDFELAGPSLNKERQSELSKQLQNQFRPSFGKGPLTEGIRKNWEKARKQDGAWRFRG
jgi:formate hydrogenlyase subunit 6/NADH:ubiquinone oxidoreductase subunit I